MLNSVLIANRGEIACRIAKTARRLGITIISIYSDGDTDSLHVDLADKAYALNGEQATDTYLNTTKILDIARASGADAIHPGYGFLSENPDFAQACSDAGITFIGPSADSIRRMGSKSAAKALMAQADVPLVPGYHGDDQTLELLHQEASKCGFPVMIKASAGGGGKGMRVVNTEEAFSDALDAVKRESLASFNNDHVLIERYITSPRHIEIQVFGDTHGNYVHLFERDCSIQRRHQKIIEEAPAPGMNEEWRQRMGSTAVKAAQSIDYVGAGTIEFIVDKNNEFYFMEMNTRLQVEHPVTEMVTGTDLVEWQFLVASGEELPATQSELALRGHSIEARIYAEDTDAGFLPASGTVTYFGVPAENNHLRIETGIRSADEVSINFDPMIAKIVSHGPDRVSAINNLQKALSQTHLIGLTNNRSFLLRVLASQPYLCARLNTDFITEHSSLLAGPSYNEDTEYEAMHVAALYQTLLMVQVMVQETHCQSPWSRLDGWRMNGNQSTTLCMIADSRAMRTHDHQPVWLTVLQQIESDSYEVSDLSQQMRKSVFTGVSLYTRSVDQATFGQLAYTIKGGGNLKSAAVIAAAKYLTVILDNIEYSFITTSPDSLVYHGESTSTDLKSPMPGKVIQVMVKAGDEVVKDQPLMILEAMKMEHTIVAPHGGVLSDVFFSVDDRVDANTVLLAFSS